MRFRPASRALVVATTVLAVTLALTPAAFGGKPDKPDKPGGGPHSRLEVAVIDLSGNEMWSILEAPGDTVIFRVTSNGATPTEGELCLTTETTTRCEFDDDGLSAPYAVQAGDIVDRQFAGTVTHNLLSAPFELGSYAGVYLGCADEGWSMTSSTTYEGSFPTSTLCLFRPYPGVWRATVSAFGEPKKPTGVLMNFKDHIPGNFCATDVDGTDILSVKLRGDETVTVEFYVPRTGVCLRGGGPGGETIGVGNPETFALAVQGDVTLEWVREAP